MYFYDIISSPIGQLLLLSSETGLKKILFEHQIEKIHLEKSWKHNPDILKEIKEQLDSYFVGELSQFSVKVDPDGTLFQKQVWAQLQEIPYGEVMTYQEIANALDKPNACRAVGMANSRNPIPILIPCHRVIGKNGSLTGYAGGLENKAKLLQIEGISKGYSPKQFSLF